MRISPILISSFLLLAACSENAARHPTSSNRYSLEGRIVDVNTGLAQKGVIVISNDKIENVFTGAVPSDVPAPLFKDLIIYPGLIDAHNHIKYNTFPLWKTPKSSYQNRYDWPNEKSYTGGMKEIYKRIYTEQPQCEGISSPEEKLKCQALGKCLVIRYGEMKGLAGGTTTIQGSSSFDEATSDFSFKGLTPYYIGKGNKRALSLARQAENALDECLKGGGRNLEREYWNGEDIIRSTAQPITASFWKGAAPKLISEFTNKDSKEKMIEKTHAFFVHLGEGQDKLSLSEYQTLETLALNHPESIVIHGTAFGPSEFAKMGKGKISLLWSPTSNLLLYKKTTDVVSAIKAGVVVAIGSDWSLSGTKSLLGELKVVDWYNKAKLKNALSRTQMMKMVTIDAAKASHLDQYIGSLEKGKLADLVIFQETAESKKLAPADFLVSAFDKDVYLTVVGGKPLYGEEVALKKFINALSLTDADFSLVPSGMCGTKNFAFALDYDDKFNSYPAVKDELSAKIADAYKALSPKVAQAVGPSFKELDPLCEYGDARFKEIIEGMKTQIP